MRAPNQIRHNFGVLQQMVSQMDEAKSILESPILGVARTDLVRPRFEDTSTWADIIRILEDDAAMAFARPSTKTGSTRRNG